jgi:hypothetical protein
MAFPRWFALPLLLSSASACGGPLAQGQAQFDRGSYPEAKQTFAAVENDRRTWSDSTRARYALYRGLTLGALGDQGQAGVWLHEAKAIEDAHPGSLTAEETQRLHLGLESICD